MLLLNAAHIEGASSLSSRCCCCAPDQTGIYVQGGPVRPLDVDFMDTAVAAEGFLPIDDTHILSMQTHHGARVCADSPSKRTCKAKREKRISKGTMVERGLCCLGGMSSGWDEPSRLAAKVAMMFRNAVLCCPIRIQPTPFVRLASRQ